MIRKSYARICSRLLRGDGVLTNQVNLRVVNRDEGMAALSRVGERRVARFPVVLEAHLAVDRLLAEDGRGDAVERDVDDLSWLTAQERIRAFHSKVANVIARRLHTGLLEAYVADQLAVRAVSRNDEIGVHDYAAGLKSLRPVIAVNRDGFGDWLCTRHIVIFLCGSAPLEFGRTA